MKRTHHPHAARSTHCLPAAILALTLSAYPVLAQAHRAVVLYDEPPTPPIWEHPLFPIVMGFGVLGVASIVAAIVFAWQGYASRPPAEKAFRTVARRLGLGTLERTAIRKLAHLHGDVEPVALMLSASAMRSALDDLARERPEFRSGLTEREVASLEVLADRQRVRNAA
ncbi:MAG: hypothetical protein RBS39_09885 [Phycisphaerales bacterium]|jgi:NADH:ubiquinone oxidoreductase subunit 5 (subunit L)/multisubunit Na+/H+ antiporter MnhA subunit|nr:hypothetical protein [Phycisphaerales bacterium]